MKASVGAQHQLLVIQDLDTKIAKLNYSRRELPVRGRIKELQAEIGEGALAVENLQSQAREAAAALKNLEMDAAQLQARIEVQEQRLAGGGKPAELIAIENDLQQLGQRRDNLETAQLEAMEASEDLEGEIGRARDRMQRLTAAVDKLCQQLAEEERQIDEQTRQLEAQRQDAAGLVPQQLLDEYERIRARTGGIGAIAVQDRRVIGVPVEFSVSQWHDIGAADPEDVLVSEDFDYIIVRL